MSIVKLRDAIHAIGLAQNKLMENHPQETYVEVAKEITQLIKKATELYENTPNKPEYIVKYYKGTIETVRRLLKDSDIQPEF